MNTRKKCFLTLLFAAFSGNSLALTCPELLGPVDLSGVLPPDITARVTYAQNNVPVFPSETAGAASSNCFVIVKIDAVPSNPPTVNPVDVINLDMELPPAAAWNQKFLMVGQGGFAGSRGTIGVPPNTRTAGVTINTPKYMPIQRGYATATTDTGHLASVPAGLWAKIDSVLGMDNEPEVNYAHRGTHLATVVGKRITERYYDSGIQHSYFIGFSNGGRQGLMEAARYPNDYDGILSGAPVQNISSVVAHFSKVTQKQFPVVGQRPQLALVDFTLIASLVIDKCDLNDGIDDNIVNDPRDCEFNIETDILTCENNIPGPNCLTTAQKDVLKAINQKTYLSSDIRDEKRAISTTPAEWTAWLGNYNPATQGISLGLYYTYGQESIRYLIEENASINVQDYALDGSRFALMKEADVPRDISQFISNGGKLILYHGWDDIAISPLATINWYKDVTNGYGRSRDNNVRLFLLPGFNHTFHSYNFNDPQAKFDFITALEQWVEQGIAPDSIASISNGGTIKRPWCMFPKKAVRINPALPDPNESNYECK